jgi:hypothetical protein
MEESELEEWFSESREKLEERYFAAVTAGKDTEKAKLEFDKGYRSLIAGFQERQAQLYEHKLRAAALKAPFARVRDRVRLFFKRIGDRWRNRGHPIRKWLFERKIRRILRDKSDL